MYRFCCICASIQLGALGQAIQSAAGRNVRVSKWRIQDYLRAGMLSICFHVCGAGVSESRLDFSFSMHWRMMWWYGTCHGAAGGRSPHLHCTLNANAHVCVVVVVGISSSASISIPCWCTELQIPWRHSSQAQVLGQKCGDSAQGRCYRRVSQVSVPKTPRWGEYVVNNNV